MANQVVRVRRETIVACMTCPLCNKLFRDATTISECLHTFCRKCIYDKISEEELECCPICNTDLGCVPLEKLSNDSRESKPAHHLFATCRCWSCKEDFSCCWPSNKDLHEYDLSGGVQPRE